MQIADQRGNVNGWTTFAKVYGICTDIGETPVTSAAAKVKGGG